MAIKEPAATRKAATRKVTAKSPRMAFSFADLIAGYVTAFDNDTRSFGLRTTDDRVFDVHLTDMTNALLVRNLGEAYVDATAQLRDMLVPGRYVFVYGVFYPQQGDHRFEAAQVVFAGRRAHEFVFEKPDWWVQQIWQMGDFYYRAQFGTGEPDWRTYRVNINMAGQKVGNRQETDTMSRLIYGLSTAYHMTGEDRFLEAAEAGVEYLRDHLRHNDPGEGISYWYHAIDIDEPNEKKILASEFGDDYDAIPAYEQIYALVGAAQVFRITRDPRIKADIDATVTLFEKFFLDPRHGGYWSHIDPVTFDGRSDSLGRNRARKNWNSVGDHIPAYLINAWLATGEQRYADMLVALADTIAERFPDDEHSAFVQERFHEDWSADTTWGWQQDRAVVGHNLKIAWNLMRIYHLHPSDRFRELAEKIGQVMPDHGMDPQRGGWYDVVERGLDRGETVHRFTWHDRKAWWQQEQAILAYLILAGSVGASGDWLRYAREASAFYNAWFLDHGDGSVYFNVLANGVPYLLGNERMKGSHSMAGYHSFELAYLATVYTNLLLTKEPMDLWFSPLPNALGEDVLRVAPDILPLGSVCIREVEIDGAPHEDFDSDEMTVRVPTSATRQKIRVRLQAIKDPFETETEFVDGTAIMTLAGKLDTSTWSEFQTELELALAKRPTRLVLRLEHLESMENVGIRVLLFARSKMDISDRADIFAVAPRPQVREILLRADPEQEDIRVVDSFEDVP